MPGSRDPGVTIVNPTEISVMYGEGVNPHSVGTVFIRQNLTSVDVRF